MTQEQIADELGLSTRMVARYEKGTHMPSRGTLLAWAQITNVGYVAFDDTRLGPIVAELPLAGG